MIWNKYLTMSLNIHFQTKALRPSQQYKQFQKYQFFYNFQKLLTGQNYYELLKPEFRLYVKDILSIK